MSPEQQNHDEESIPLEESSEPQPVPVNPRSQPVPVPPPKPAILGPDEEIDEEESSGPIPVPPPGASEEEEEEEEEEPIALEDVDPAVASQRRAFGSAARSTEHKEEFTRPLNTDGAGATRCRLFTSKISQGPLLNMERLINEWLDSDEIEVKHVGHIIGTMEGKRAEPNLLVMVWY